ncbi:MAG: hypothetical protein ACI4XM_02520 [Candidatus Coprovivens sp.]
MRKEGLLKYTVFLLVCFFSLFITSVNAKDVTKNVTLSYGSTYPISSSGYENFNCDTSTLSALQAVSNSTGYTVSLKNVMKEKGTESLVCTYSKEIALGDGSSGKITYNITYTEGKEETFEYSLGLGNNTIDIFSTLGAIKMLGHTVQSKNSEYIEVSGCNNGDLSCKVSLSKIAESIEDDGNNYISIVVFQYNVSGSDAVYTANVHFNINSNAAAFIWDNWTDDSPLGFCSYDSDWKQMSNTRSNGQTVYYYKSTVSGATLPNCTPNSSSVVPVTFKGWVSGVEGTTGISFQNGNGSYLYATGKCPTTISPGTVATIDTNYAPCYETSGYFVRLSLSTGKVEESGWTVSSSSNYEYYHMGTSENDEVTLPDVVYTGFNSTKSLQCWENTTTGACVPAGTKVKTDGTVYKAVTDTVHEDYSYYKTVKVNDAVVFAVEGMKSCQIGSGQPSGYIDVSSINGDCMVLGLKETEDSLYIDVEISLESGNKKIYKFSVDSDTGLSAAGNGEFIVNPIVNSGEENAYTDSSGFKSSVCDTYWIQPGQSRIVPNTGSGTRMHSNIYSVTSNCSGDSNHYVAVCLDPGREAPESGADYQKVKDISGAAGSDFNKLISYLVANNYVNEFTNIDSYKRMAAHIAIRIVAFQSGMGSSSGIIYGSAHAVYQNTVNAIQAKKPTTVSAYTDIINENMPGIDSTIVNYIATILSEYPNISDADTQGFERTIESAETVASGSGYIITYKGTITAPSTASNVNLVAPSSANGVSFKVVNWAESGTDENGRTIYNYEVQISASNTLSVVPPSTEAEKILMSFKVKYDGGKTVSNVFLAQPIGTAGALQRMLIFNTNNSDLYIYFNVAPNDCELPGLDYKDCTSADSCSNFNAALFKASGCCRYVTDEVKYSYVVNNVCAAKCTTSTMSNVCDYSVSNKLAELYEIREGTEYNGSATGSGSGYQNAIATCVVNVDRDIRVEDDKELFEKEDDNGNSISIKYYENNKYCRINCKEDWQISMDAFGNYVGEKAVAAGSYFQIENDIFISGKRTCYTNYIDYNAYMNDLVVISQQIVSGYNEYSNLSHSWSDIDKQESPTSGGFSHSSTDYTYRVSYKVVSTCPKDNPKTEDVDESLGECSLSVEEAGREVIETYYGYTLKVNHEFEGAGDKGQGNYQNFTTKPFDSQGTVSSGSKDTQTKLESEDGSTKQYNVPDDVMSINIDRHDPPSTGACTPPRGGSCDAGTYEDVYEDTTTSYTGLTVGPYTEDNPDEAGAFSKLKEEMLKKLEADMAGPRGAVGGGAAQIRRLIDQMYECQHFQLVNSTDDNNDFAKTDRLNGQYYDTTMPYIEITTAFDPDVTYEYAEDAFMSILLNNRENYLEMYNKKNDAYYGGTEGAYKNATNQTKLVDLKLSSTQTEKVNLSRNYLQLTYYKSGSLWQANSETGRNYDNGSGSNTIQEGVMEGTLDGQPGAYKEKTISLCGISCGGKSTYVSTTNSKGVTSGAYVCNDDPKWDGGACFDTVAPYLEANYIKSSIENSSFYKNQGSWYSNIQDVKAHGAGLEAALNNENANNKSGYNVSSELSSGRWTPIGIINVFPISLTTPRNLYTYTYTFKDIGSLYGGDLGRIMGAENAIIANNNRTCFYEVFEELCLCCGDKINTYVYNDPDENDLIKQVMSQSGYRESNTDKIEENEGGTLSFATSSVNLSDIAGNSSRPIATNWSNNSPFTYGGEYNLSTSKGDQLKSAIESQGETIYTSSIGNGAEYSYYLTPSTLTKIREYNDAHGYELNFNNLKVYGRYSIAALSSCSDVTSDSCWKTSDDLMNDEVINFQHYGSVFLEELAKDPNIVKSSTLAKEGNDKVCAIVDNNVSAAAINKLVKEEHCRWIDFVEDLSDNSGRGETIYTYPYSEYTSSPETVRYFRLAFK